MSLHPQTDYRVPEDTERVARAIFPQANLVMRMYDDLGMVFCDGEFADLFPVQGQPAEAPARLALVTILQFMEGLTDRQASDAVRTRIDWKYLLCLELTDPGFHHSVLSEFRTRLLTHGAERRLFDTIVLLARNRSLLKAGGRQRTDSTHILGAMRTQTRLEVVIETLRHALNVLADVAPDWLRTHTSADWVDRYGLRANEYRLPKSDAKRIECGRANWQRWYQAVDCYLCRPCHSHSRHAAGGGNPSSSLGSEFLGCRRSGSNGGEMTTCRLLAATSVHRTILRLATT